MWHHLPLSAIAALLLLAAISSAADLHCYMPDGSNADQGTAPCNTTAEVSACCDPRDSCTESGLCLGASGWIYRSACTDQTWTSDACPSDCHTDPILNSSYSSYAPIYPCAAGVGTPSWCCASYAQVDDPSCCFANFTLANTGLAFKPGTDAMLAEVSSLSSSLAALTAASTGISATGSTVTVTATASATTTAAAAGGGGGEGASLGTAVGVGVGVPLAVLALGVIAFLVWRERRRQKELEARIAGAGPVPAVANNGHGYDVQNGSGGGYVDANGHRVEPWMQQQQQQQYAQQGQQPMSESHVYGTPFQGLGGSSQLGTVAAQGVGQAVITPQQQPWKDPALEVRHEMT